jgi:ABC-type transport system involved in multi-copper enzyme maturation permease subunit
MTTIFHIAGDSIRALLHKRLLMAIILASIGMTTIFSVVLGKFQDQVLQHLESTQMMPDEEELDGAQRQELKAMLQTPAKIFVATFYWFNALGGAFIALFICCTAVSSEIRQGTVRVTLTKPVSRSQFLLGKYCGGVVVLAVYALIVGLSIVFFADFHKLDMGPAIHYAPWLIFCSNLMLGSIGMLLSLYVPPLIAAVLAFFISASYFSPPNPLYYILPSYDRFNIFLQLFKGSAFALWDVFSLSLYALDVTAVVLLVALWRFKAKELI